MEGSLPLADANLLKQAARQYDKRSYPKVLRTLEKLLERHPKHSAILALKAKTEHQLGKTEEAFVTAKAALRANLKSSDCWETMGILHRSRSSYSEAAGCFAKALGFNPDSLHCLTNLGSLYAHLRNYGELLKVRHSLLIKQANAVNNWVGYSIALHLTGDLVTAMDVVTSLLNSQALKADLKPYDISQLILYKARLMMESGGFSGALALLNAEGGRIKYRLKAESRKAEVLIELGRLEDAKRVVIDLLQNNSENSDYHALLRRCLGLDELLRTYQELAETFPASNFIAKSILRFSAGNEFAVALDKFLKAKLKKGVPSLI
jgi:peptide alpha-N-acetyltransferase